MAWSNDGGVFGRYVSVATPGDANGDGKVDVADVFWLINYLFVGGPVPPSISAADADGNGTVDVFDVLRLINYIFAGGPPPV